MISWLFRNVLFSLHVFVFVIGFFSRVNIESYRILIREVFYILKFTKAWFMDKDSIYHRECSMCTWEKCAIYCFGMKCPVHINWAQLVQWFIQSCVSLLIFCLNDLSIGVNGVLTSITLIVLLLFSPSIVFSTCLMYWGAPLKGTYIF